MEHTKGPWKVGYEFVGDDSVLVVINSDGDEICNFGNSLLNEPANAQLIAAAPDLYAVLKAIIDDLPISRGWLDPVNERWAKDALKKARGES